VYYGVLDCWDKVRCPEGCWDKVRCPEGCDALDVAVEQAKDRPLNIPGSLGALYTTVASVAYHLSLHLHPNPLFLPRERLAELLGTSAITISRVVSLLVSKKVLNEEDATWSYQKHKCKTYTFVPFPGMRPPA
jgi:hypothetical protein